MRIALFCPAYRYIVRVQHEFSLMQDLNFCHQVDLSAERQRGSLFQSLLEHCLAEGRAPTPEELETAQEEAAKAAEKRFDLIPHWRSSTNIDLGRNQAVQFAKDNDCDLLYMIDADCFVPSGGGSGLAQLISTMSQHGAAAVGAAFVCRSKENMNCEPARPNEIYEGDVGTGMMLVDVHQLDGIEEPYFRTELTPDGKKVKCGEDIYFCRKLRAAGRKVLVDYTILTGHGSEEVLECNPALLQSEKATRPNVSAVE